MSESFSENGIETNGAVEQPKLRQARMRSNAQLEALTQAHIGLMEHEVITRSQQADLFRLVNNQFAALQSWHDQHTGWRIRRSPAVIRLVRVPVALTPGYVFRVLREPRDFACFCWALWYAESRQLAGRGNDQQFLMSQLAERLEEQSQTGELAPHVAPLDFKKQTDRFSLRRALEALQDLGGLQLVDGGAEEWANQTGQADALWEFTEVTRSLMLSLEPLKVQAVGRELDGNPNTLRPALLPDAEVIEPLQRAWRTLLLGPTLLKYDDPAAFQALKEHIERIRHELAETFGWQLDLRREYAAIIRASGTAAGPVTLLNLQGAADQAALLCCTAIRQKITSGEWSIAAIEGCLIVPQGELAEIFRQVRERYGDQWGNTARKTHFPQLLREVYAKMRQAGLMRGPDRAGNVLILPAAARFEVDYLHEDEEDEISAASEAPEKPAGEQLSFGLEIPANKVDGSGKIYNTVEVAKIMGVSQQSITNWIKAGRLKATQQGRGWAIPAEEVARLKRFGNGNGNGSGNSNENGNGQK